MNPESREISTQQNSEGLKSRPYYDLTNLCNFLAVDINSEKLVSDTTLNWQRQDMYGNERQEWNKRADDLPDGLRQKKAMRSMAKKAEYNFDAEEDLEFARELPDNNEIWRASALANRYRAGASEYKSRGDRYPEGNQRRQEMMEWFQATMKISEAVGFAINQASYRMYAYKFEEASEKRRKNEEFAQEEGQKAKEALYKARKDPYINDYFVKIENKWSKQRLQQERDKQRLEPGQEPEIEYPQWLNKYMQQSESEDNQSEMSEENLNWIASKHADWLCPDATEEERTAIKLDWVKNKPYDLKRVEEEFNEEVRECKKVVEIIHEDMQPQQQKEIALKKAYRIYTSTPRFKSEMNNGGWVEAIVKWKYILSNSEIISSV